MTITSWLTEATTKLDSALVDTARLDAEVLLASTLDVDRSWVLAHPEHILDEALLSVLSEQLTRRKNHEPLAYILGKKEFFGRDFVVTADTLTPRPETETMVELLKELVGSRQLTVDSQLQIIDVGTGSGCIAVTIKLELPNCAVYGTDISEKALAIAQKNAIALGADVEFIRADLLSKLDADTIDGAVLCCNLPYVPDEHPVNQATTHEPRLALFSGVDGLRHYRKLFTQVRKLSSTEDASPAFILTESLQSQHAANVELAKEAGYTLRKNQDLIQVFSR